MMNNMFSYFTTGSKLGSNNVGTLKGIETDSQANFDMKSPNLTLSPEHVEGQNGLQILVRRLTHSALRIPCRYISPSAQVKAAGRSHPETRMEPAKERTNPESRSF